MEKRLRERTPHGRIHIYQNNYTLTQNERNENAQTQITTKNQNTT